MASQLELSEPFASLWKNKDAFREVRELSGKVFRELEGRKTIECQVADKAYFAKMHSGIGWAEILKNLIRLKVPIIGAKSEYLALKKLADIGIDSLLPVAFGQRGYNPAAIESFLVTEALTETISLEDFCRPWPITPPKPEIKRAIIEKVAAIARRLHQAGVNHRDLYLCHFLLHVDRPLSPAEINISLIDLHRAQIRAAVPRRWRNKDLAALAYSSSAIGLTRSDQLRFLTAYFQAPLRDILHHEADLLRFLAKEINRLSHRWDHRFSAQARAQRGQWHIAEEAPAALLQAFPTLSSVFSCQGELITQDPLSQVVRVRLGGCRYYIKRYTGAGKHLRRWLGRARVRAEWENLQHFKAWGIPTAALLAFGEERSLIGFQRGALITQEIPNTEDLAALARRHDPRLKQGPWLRSVLYQVADMASRLHQQGFVHNDLKWRNILVDQGQPPEGPKAYLIDCPSGSRWPWPLLSYKKVKDLACLDKVAKTVLSKSQRLRFYLRYAGVQRLTPRHKEEIRRVLAFFQGRE